MKQAMQRASGFANMDFRSAILAEERVWLAASG